MTNPGKKMDVIEVEVQHSVPGKLLIRKRAVALQPLDTKMLIAAAA
jgi:NADPH:quinone reductase-like Zn-dependent oxidoreductase